MRNYLPKTLSAAAALLILLAGCSQAPKSGVKRMEAGKEHSGFLKDYANLKPNALLGGEAISFVNQDKMKSLKRYVAIIVDPVDVYVASDAKDAEIPDRAREVVANYFERALANAVADAYPIVDSPGPLVLRLRAAIVGVDQGGATAPISSPAATTKPLEKAIVLEKVGIELELVDSETGEQIAALVDKERLGAGAEVGSPDFSRDERAAEARRAFDEWAGRLRDFLNANSELSEEDAAKAKAAYQPYGQQ
jgi:hypothetical protein